MMLPALTVMLFFDDSKTLGDTSEALTCVQGVPFLLSLGPYHNTFATVLVSKIPFPLKP